MFKAKGKPESSIRECKITADLSDEEEANFMRRLKRRQGKYKIKLSFKCGRIGHFSSKCTCEENRETKSEEESKSRERRG